MECVVEEFEEGHSVASLDVEAKGSNITFLYTLGEGGCPKSFVINGSRLAGQP
jgi:DNA mismatch repair protein MSH6